MTGVQTCALPISLYRGNCSPELRELGIVDRVIPETFNGEQLPRYKVAHIMKKALDRKSAVYGKSVDLGGRRIIKKKKKIT